MFISYVDNDVVFTDFYCSQLLWFDDRDIILMNTHIMFADVVEISSSDEDVVMLDSDRDDDDDDEDDEPEEEEEEAEEEDPNNSGSHVNDAMNLPDAEGRVLVNVGHPLDEPDIFLAPQLSKAVKPHQVHNRHTLLLSNRTDFSTLKS